MSKLLQLTFVKIYLAIIAAYRNKSQGVGPLYGRAPGAAELVWSRKATPHLPWVRVFAKCYKAGAAARTKQAAAQHIHAIMRRGVVACGVTRRSLQQADPHSHISDSVELESEERRRRG